MADLSTPVSSKDHIEGADDASITLVEYGDYQCPDCGEAYPIVKKLQRHFGSRMRFVFRNYPLEMHDAIYEHQRELSEEMLTQTAENLGLDGKALQGAWGSDALEQRVQDDVESGDDSGVHGTPTFFINGMLWENSYDFGSLVEGIEQVVSSAK